MNKFPSKKIYIITFLIILSYLTLDFQMKGRRDFLQLNYDWNNIKIVNEVEEEFFIDSISYDYVSIFKKSNQQEFKGLDIKNTFCFQNKFYFRCSSIVEKENRIVFSGGYWINAMPEKQIKNSSLTEVDLPLIQTGGRTICMIGDSQFVWKYGKYTRREISKKVKNADFIGRDKDVYGYSYEAEILNNSNKILKEIENIPSANLYILFLGAHEDDLKSAKNDLEKIIITLINRKAEIILICPPAYQNMSKLGVNKEIYEVYNMFVNQKQVTIINLSDYIESNDNYFLADGIHLNMEGHKLLTTHLIKSIKK